MTISTGAVWSLQTISSGIPSSGSLCIKFTNNGTAAQYRIDDVKLVGTCSSSNHTVTFNANGGTGSMSAQTASTTTNLTSNTFTQSGCSFTGWNTAANGSGSSYSDNQSYSFASDLTLYAQWNCGSICPFIVSAVINSCDGCAAEGNNEFVVLNTGSYAFNINSTNVKITYSNGPTNITTGFAAQPASLATLNTATLNACGTTFIDVSSGATTVPANSTLLIINKGACFTGDWSSYCGLGNVYVAFSSTSAWTTTGFFGNNTTPRNFVTDFSAVNSACGSTTYSYNQSGVAGTPFAFGNDGASVVFNGSSSPTYVNGNGVCAPPSIILPIDLLDFYATQNDTKNDLIWKVSSEKNVFQYIIEKSDDGITFSEIARVAAHNIEDTYFSYNTEDLFPNQGITYYRLSTVGNDKVMHYHKIIYSDRTGKDWKTLLYQNNNVLILEFKNLVPKNANVSLFDLTGNLLVETSVIDMQTKISTSNFSDGVYFVKIHTPYQTENFKIIIQK